MKSRIADNNLSKICRTGELLDMRTKTANNQSSQRYAQSQSMCGYEGILNQTDVARDEVPVHPQTDRSGNTD